MNLHELVDLPHGKAKEYIIKAGQWREDFTFQDVLDRLEDKRVIVIDSKGVLVCDHQGDDEYIEYELRKAMED